MGWRLEEEVCTTEVGKKQVTPGWVGEQKRRQAPRKLGESKLFRGARQVAVGIRNASYRQHGQLQGNAPAHTFGGKSSSA